MPTGAVQLVIENGMLVTDSWTAKARSSSMVVAITAILDTASEPPDAERVIDAAGKLVLPGGVDPHCHIAVPLGEFVTLDNFESASLAALAGGTTTIIDFAIPTPGEHPTSALAPSSTWARTLAATTRCTAASQRASDDVADIGAAFVSSGVRTVKLFTTYRGLLMVEIDTIEKVMAALNEVSGLTYVHAEANDLVESAQETAESRRAHRRSRDGAHPAGGGRGTRGRRGAGCCRADGITRSTSSTSRLPAAVDQVTAARQRGVFAFSESCPHYLSLDASSYAGEHPERYVCCPPLRDRATVDELGQRLALGICPHRGQRPLLLRLRAEGASRPRRPGDAQRPARRGDAASGDLGRVRRGRADLARNSSSTVIAANPARLNGLYPRKGTIAPGSDADLVIFDPAATRSIQRQRSPHGNRLHAVRGPAGDRLAEHGGRPWPGRGRRRRAPRPWTGRRVPARRTAST